MQHLKVEIALPSRNEAKEVLDNLLEDRLIAGGHYFLGVTKHWWKENIDSAEYYYVNGYTTSDQKEKIIECVTKLSSEDVPGIVFYEIQDANQDFLKWIDSNVT